MNSVVEVCDTGTANSNSVDFIGSNVESFFYNDDGAEFVGELTKSMIEVGVKVWGAITGILYFFKPKDDPFWGEGVGLASMGFAFSLWKFSTIFSSSDPSGVAKEAFGVALAFIGLILTLNPNLSMDILLGSLVLSGIGFLITMLNKDVYDRLPVAPLKNIEETISLLIVLYSIASIGSEFHG